MHDGWFHALMNLILRFFVLCDIKNIKDIEIKQVDSDIPVLIFDIQPNIGKMEGHDNSPHWYHSSIEYEGNFSQKVNV